MGSRFDEKLIGAVSSPFSADNFKVHSCILGNS